MKLFSYCFLIASVLALSSDGLMGATGPVALWRGEGNANDSAGSLNGTLINGTTFAAGVAPTQGGQAFSFDGSDDEVRFGNTEGLNLSAGFSVSGWMRTSGTAAFSGLIDRFFQSGTTSGFQVSMSGDNGFPPNRSGILRADLGFGAGYTTAFNLARVDDGLAHHFALVWNGAEARLYVDGVPGETVAIQNWAPNTADIVLGSDTDAGGRHFNGQLDEIAIYDRALTALEVEALAGKLRLDITLASPGQVLVSWPSVAIGFRLQANDSLDPATWTTATTETTNRVAFAATGSTRFYRLINP